MGQKGLNSKIKNLLIKLLVVLGSCLLSLVLVDTIARAFSLYPSRPARFLFFTKPLLRDQITTFGFLENIHVREIAIYPDKKNIKIEYDTTFTTNNIGLVQKGSFDKNKKSLVVIGDSFTQGEGATPWFYELEKNWQNDQYQLINLGLMGTGVEQWKYMLQWFSTIGEIKHIFICFISEDWRRPRWVPCENPELNGLVLTRWMDNTKITQSKEKPIFYFIDKDEEVSAILTKAEILKERDEISENSIRGFLNNFHITQHFINYLFNSQHNRLEYFNENKTSFDKIVSSYGCNNITAIHIPEKDEVMQSAYNDVSRQIREFIFSRNIQYIDGLALCGLSREDFYEHDHHFNVSGYEKLSQFFQKTALRNLKP